MRRFSIGCLVATAVSSALPAQTPGQAALLARAQARGALIYAYDQAAWHGTDDLFAKLPHPEERVGGYVVDGPASAPRLVFYDKMASKAVYVAHFAGNRLTDAKLLGDADDVSLSPLDHRLIAARATASRALAADRSVFTCAAKPFNTVVLPPDTAEGPVSVYFLTPQTSNDAIPFGGHYQVDVDAAGRAGTVRPFSKSCIAAPTHPKLPKGSTPSMFVVTSVLDAVPTEVHVFASLALRLPVGVVTGGTAPQVWPVTGGTIGAPITIKR